MKKTIPSARIVLLAALFSAIAAMTPTATNASPIVYSIVNNSAVQNGYTVSGTITTDGSMGEIYAASILSWNFLVSNGANSYSANSSQAGSSVGLGPVGGIYATASYLELQSSTVSSPYGVDLVGATTLIQWTGSTLQNGAFTSACRVNGNTWIWWQDYITTTPYDVSGGWAIANNGTPVGAVPDAGLTGTMLAMAMVGLGWMRRKI